MNTNKSGLFVALLLLLLGSFFASSGSSQFTYDPADNKEDVERVDKIIDEISERTSFDEKFQTMDQYVKFYPIESIKKATSNAVTAIRLPSPIGRGPGVFVVQRFNFSRLDDHGDYKDYPEKDDSFPKVRTLVMIIGKPSFESPIGDKSQNASVTEQTMDDIEAFKGMTTYFTRKSFLDGLAKVRNGIFNEMNKDNGLFYDSLSLGSISKFSPSVAQYIYKFYANAAPSSFNSDKAGFVITQQWKSEYFPNENRLNLGQMYVVSPEPKDIAKNTWLSLIYTTARNIIANMFNVIQEDLKSPTSAGQLGLQVHLPGAGRFLFPGLSINHANAIFTQGLLDGINKITNKNQNMKNRLILYFAFSPCVIKDGNKCQEI